MTTKNPAKLAPNNDPTANPTRTPRAIRLGGGAESRPDASLVVAEYGFDDSFIHYFFFEG